MQAAGDDLGTMEASERVCDALRAIGVTNQVTELAGDLLDHRTWIID